MRERRDRGEREKRERERERGERGRERERGGGERERELLMIAHRFANVFESHLHSSISKCKMIVGLLNSGVGQ